jgi:transcriptional regulator with XRE-family HTH domain
MARPSRQPPRSKIAARRLEAELSQKELSELSGLSMRTVQRLDAGELQNPPIRYLVNIALVLDTPVLDICEDEWLKWTVLDASAAKPPPKGRRRSNRE